MIEYRTANGRRIEIAANGHVLATPVADVAANLRNHGCPEHIIEKHEIRTRAAAAMKRGTPTTSEPSIAELKAKAAAIGQQIAEDAKRFGDQ